MSVSGVSDPFVGSLLSARYEVLSKIARGGMATVYLAQDTRLGRTVAIKVMHQSLTTDPEFVLKFNREARAAARLNHPNVVAVFDQGVDDDCPYIVMEYVAGTTLRQLLSDRGRLLPVDALELMEPIAAALAAAHAEGLVHRDIKPENVLISASGQVKVVDFGLAKAETGDTVTTPGNLIGTVSYLPPEVVTSGMADARSDIYSAGVVLYELLTGSKPYRGESPIQIAYAHCNNDIPAPSSQLQTCWRTSRNGVPPYLDALVRCAAAREPGMRPRDGEVLLDRIRRARHALSRGVMNDPRLDAVMRSGEADSLSGRIARPAAVLSRAAQEVSDRTSHWLPRGGLPVATPVSPVDYEATAATEPMAVPAVPDAPAVGPNRPGAAPVTRPAPAMRSRAGRAAPPHAGRARLTAARTASVRAAALRASHRSQVSAPTAAIRRNDPAGIRPPSRRSSTAQRPGTAQRRPVPRWRPLAALTVLVCLTALLGYGGWYAVAGRFTAVPGTTAITGDAARANLAGAGLRAVAVDEFSETVPPGQVIRTDPPGGARVAKGRQVRTFVSKGPERFTMPKVAGLSQADARAALAAANLAVGAVTESWHDDAAAGAVVSASSPEGSALKRGAPVDLVVSKGPAPAAVIDCTGKPFDGCAPALTKAGFAVNRSERPDKAAAGTVLTQNPASGMGKKGDAVTLVVSSGPALVAVPDVRQKDQPAAEEALKSAGFAVKVEKLPNPVPFGVVSYSAPGSGEKVPEGSTVTIYVL